MNTYEIAAPLAAALAKQGYETLTAVQNAVLATEARGRDLLVSAQTGSGKTVAFGIAIADQILGGLDKLLYADVPLGLIIAPTRELALQVARELEWLYGPAGAQIATCVGGMDYRSEKRALDRGAHIVVGTPGRLRDHIERRSLDLTGLRAAVLDEADEMLDLGFREDLEFILSAAPEDRRTLMFSATVSKDIAKLAGDFQRDALRIAAQGEAKQHVDIEYRAYSVAVRDREHAIFNALRYYDARAAIVFCKTRANVNQLLARMGNRGFQVVALSGELSQSERTLALQSLRDGRAKVCVATDVAARGIDLKGLDLVIHADLPSNSETLLHRSGRTGRAGSKGVSALIVSPSEFKKAQRLLQGAKVVAEWGPAPGADDVQGREDLRLAEHPFLQAPLGDDAELAQTLVDRYGAAQTAAAFVRMWREGRSAPDVLSDTAGPPKDSAPRERGEFGPSVWFSLSVGRAGRAEARWLLPKICDAGGISKDAIGAIRVQENQTYVQIATAQAGKFGAGVELESGVQMARLEGEPNLDRPERAPRDFADKPRGKPAAKPYAKRDDAAKSYDDKPARPPRADKPAYTPKPARVVEDQSAYNPLGGSDRAPAEAPAPKPERKPYAKREDGAKPYGAKRDAKPYGAKPYAAKTDDKPYGAKPYAKREDGDKPYGAKPYAKREDGAKPYAPKPYAKRDDAAPAGKPYAAKPYAKKEAGRDFGDAKPYAPRSTGFKSHGGGKDAPARAAGFKSHGAEGKPVYKGKTDKPKADARDTSKRFVPPKKK
ncbi:MAG: DEAD/DEAH box helicase [Cypionkella sp.]|nr:DEAD/DEAH box helicase [Cypionkella sp.]